MDVDRERVDARAAQQPRDARVSAELADRHPAPVARRGKRQRGGHRGLADAALAGDHDHGMVENARIRAHYGGRPIDPPMDPTLRPAYAACRRMQRRHDPTLLRRDEPAAARGAACDPCRLRLRPHAPIRSSTAPTGPPTPDARRAALDAWERELERARAGERAHPVPTALVDAGARHGLPLDELRTYMTLDARRLRAGADPRRRRARPLHERQRGRGRADHGAADRRARAGREEVARLGMAFQLANFVRDVREDWALDRIYLPGLPESDLDARPAGDGFRERVGAPGRPRARRCSARPARVDAAGRRRRVRHGMCLARDWSTGASWTASSAPGYDVLAA